jgi:hypothetical protein
MGLIGLMGLIGFYPILNAITLSGFSGNNLQRLQFFFLFGTLALKGR